MWEKLSNTLEERPGLALAQMIVVFTHIVILAIYIPHRDDWGSLWQEGIFDFLAILLGFGVRHYFRSHDVKPIFRSSITYALWWSWATVPRFSLGWLNLALVPIFLVVTLFVWARVLGYAWKDWKERRRVAKSKESIGG